MYMILFVLLVTKYTVLRMSKSVYRIADEYRNKKRPASEKAGRSVCYLHQVGDFTSPLIPYFGAFAALNLAINCCVEASKLSLSASP